MDSFPSVSIELIFLPSGFGASKSTFALISTGGFLLFMMPMEPWCVSTRSMTFGAIVDKFVGDCSGKFDDFHPFSAQSTGGLAKSVDHQDWVALLYNLVFYEVPLHTW
jgi:hypothetical protein